MLRVAAFAPSYALLLAYDFSKIHTLVDVGGGRGQFLRTVLQVNPQMTGIVFDEESVIEGAKEHLKGDTSAGRCSLAAGDFFESLPVGADAYVMCGVIHDWDDERSTLILKNCLDRASAPERRAHAAMGS